MKKGIILAMDKLLKKQRTLFIWSMLSTILFIVGIPLIPIFAGSNTLLMVLGIVFTVYGFYATPLFWVFYGTQGIKKRVYVAITEEHLLTNREIAMQLQVSERDVYQTINYLIKKMILTGYLYNGVELTLSNKRKPEKEIIINKCKQCGASIEHYGEANAKCLYCGTIYKEIN